MSQYLFFCHVADMLMCQNVTLHLMGTIGLRVFLKVILELKTCNSPLFHLIIYLMDPEFWENQYDLYAIN